jgi:phosphoglucomutase
LLSPETLQRIQQWFSSDVDEASRREVQRLLDRGNEAELEDRFALDMEFGTGGLRGIMAAGTNRMNTYTVARAAQGLANYIHAQRMRQPSVVIAYDSRRHSRDFAKTAAEVLAANDVRVHLFRRLRPTPLLSFAVRELCATAGIVITSSHNPKEYNGLKVCWDDGAQVVPPHDDGIIAEVKKIASPAQLRRVPFDQALADGQIRMVGVEMDRAYLRAIRPQSLHRETIRRVAGDFRIVYTPLHGTGATVIPKALRSWGFRNVTVVPSQARPDGNFPTVKHPNPEYHEAMAEALALAKRTDAHLVLGSDPDADRLGAGVRVGRGRYQMFTGNQLGALLADYLCRELKATGRLPDNPLIVTTIVTTDLIERIGERYGVAVEETLTGFKWICEKIRLNEERRARGEPWRAFLFGTEESYGYLVGTAARDKDSVVTSCVCAEMAAEAFAWGKNLAAVLDEIEMREGAFLESQESIFHEGIEGTATIKRMMDSLRQDPPHRIGGVEVAAVGDVERGRWRVVSEKRKRPLKRELRTDESPLKWELRTLRIDLPKSDVLIFQLADGSKVLARPSGTEPKIKFYFNLCERRGLPWTSRARLAEARAALARKMKRIKTDFVRIATLRT